MRLAALIALCLTLSLVAVAGCDTDDPFSPNIDNNCDFSFSDSGSGKDYGASCTSDDECRYKKCLLGGADGNLATTSFGFCTRGCDCGTTATRLTDAEKVSYICMLPPGNQGKWRHVAVKCGSVADCKAIDDKYTDCGLPGSGVTNICLEK